MNLIDSSSEPQKNLWCGGARARWVTVGKGSPRFMGQNQIGTVIVRGYCMMNEGIDKRIR